jgi:signal transduction histidine kinase
MVHFFSFSYFNLYPDKIMAMLSYILYFKFGRHFIDASSRYPQMNKFIIKAEHILTAYVVFDILLFFLFDSFNLETSIFLFMNLLISIFLVYIFWNIIKKNETLDRFIIAGSMFYAISACLTVWIGHTRENTNANDFLIILQIGTLIEMIFLNAGIVYKSKMLQNQTIHSQQLLIVRYRENQNLLLRLANIRERISRDLHDDVGSTLSSIKAYSEILKDNPENPLISELINTNSIDMIEKLEVIAWATNPEHDNLESLLSQMKKFAHPLCHAKNVACSIEANGIDEDFLIPGEVRQNIFFIFKEAVNNMIKYAEATKFSTKVLIHENDFVLNLTDNGKGFDGNIKGSGNGWKNMEARTSELKGQLRINSVAKQGTSISLHFPFPFQIPNSWDGKTQAV